MPWFRRAGITTRTGPCSGMSWPARSSTAWWCVIRRTLSFKYAAHWGRRSWRDLGTTSSLTLASLSRWLRLQKSQDAAHSTSLVFSADLSGLAHTATSCIYDGSATSSSRVAVKPSWPKSRYAQVSRTKVIYGAGSGGCTAFLSLSWLPHRYLNSTNLHDPSLSPPQIATF